MGKRNKRTAIERVKIQADRGYKFASVLYDTMVAGGGQLAPEETVVKRWKICQSCAFFDSTKNRCKVCGCRLRGVNSGFRKNLANKLAHFSSFCPKGKWGRAKRPPEKDTPSG